MNVTVRLAALAAFIVTLAPPGARATLITGQMSISGSVVVDAQNIDWTPIGPGGNINVDAFVGNTGFFTTLAGETGTVLDLNLASTPVNTPNLGLADFITFSAFPGLTFTLNFIAPGPFSSAQCFDAPAAGQVCTYPGWPFGLSNTTANSTDVSLVLYGTVSDGSSSPPSAFRGTLTTQFNVPYQSLLNTIFQEGGSVSNTYSGTFVVTAVPESASIFLLGAGLLGIAVTSRKRRR